MLIRSTPHGLLLCLVAAGGCSRRTSSSGAVAGDGAPAARAAPVARAAAPARGTPAPGKLGVAVELASGGKSAVEACAKGRCDPELEPDGASGPTRLAAPAPPFHAAQIAQGTGGENHLVLATAPNRWWRFDETLDVASHSTTSTFTAFEVVAGRLLVLWTASGETCTSYALVCGVGASNAPSCIGPLTVGEGCGAPGEKGTWRHNVVLQPDGVLAITAASAGAKASDQVGTHELAFP